MEEEQRNKKICDNDLHVDEGPCALFFTRLAAEILVRLPAKDILRFGAVCKDWLRITKCPCFRAEHARLRPLEALLYTRTTAAVPDVGLQEEMQLDAVAVSGGHAARRPVARYRARAEPPNGGWKQYSLLLASCDGLLLLGVGYAPDGGVEQYLICNPTTRQWSELPRLGCDVEAGAIKDHLESGFYFHEPSGEYRLLCYVTFESSSGQAPYYCVLSAGADVPRRLSVQATPMEQTVASLERSDGEYRSLYNMMTPAVLDGHLHWLQHMEAGLSGEMVAFDTAAETFRRMPPPPVTWKEKSNLLVADGSLMACETGHLFVDLWVLQGYAGAAGTATGGDERWERRHRVEVPWKGDKILVAAGDDGGDVVLGTQRGVVAYNVRSGAVRQVAGVGVSQRVFRESLVRHGFFDARPHPGLPFFTFCA